MGIDLKFQSTRPLRGATHNAADHRAVLVISIHAPLAGRDKITVPKVGTVRYFNPRAPCGARPSSARRCQS